jgi:hypothetical protein
MNAVMSMSRAANIRIPEILFRSRFNRTRIMILLGREDIENLSRSEGAG